MSYLNDPRPLLLYTLNNMTFNNITMANFLKVSDTSVKYTIETDSAPTCVVSTTDTRMRFLRFTNSSITSSDPYKVQSIWPYFKLFQYFDKSRSVQFLFENITCYNLITRTEFLYVTTNIADVNFTNIVMRNVS